MSQFTQPLPENDLQHILDHTKDYWNECRGKHIFITGGTGFFGRWLIESFVYANQALSLGSTATILSRNPDAFLNKADFLSHRQELRFIQGDVRNFVFPKQSYHYIIHAATDDTARSGDSAFELVDSVISGTQHILDFAAAAGIHKLLLTSSGASYGPQPPNLLKLPESYIAELGTTIVSSTYGEAKRMAENLASNHARKTGYDLIIARCFAFVGPHLPLDSVYAIGNFIADIRAGRPIQIKGDGTPVRSYLYAADLAIWLWTLLFQRPSNQIFNVGSDEAINISDLARLVSLTLGSPLEPMILTTPSHIRPADRYVPDITRARTELGLKVHIPLASAIDKTHRWLG